MCGILFELSRVDSCNSTSCVSETLVNDVSRRGPDSLRTVEVITGSLRLRFTASVLSLRGTTVVPQPLTSNYDQNNNSVSNAPEYLLCWNGEAWRFDGHEFKSDENDAQLIFEKLKSSNGEIQNVLQKIEGPFALVFYDITRRRLWFGRDWLGRRSLLLKRSPLAITISSIADSEVAGGWEEVEADGFYYIDLVQVSTHSKSSELEMLAVQKILFIPQADAGNGRMDDNVMKLPIPALCKDIPPGDTVALTPDSLSVKHLYSLLHDSLRLRIQNIPLHSVPLVPDHVGVLRPSKVGILFSGGLDCTMLARIAHDILPIEEPIELLNVAFENRRVLDAAITENKKLKRSKKHTAAEAGGGGLSSSGLDASTSAFVSAAQVYDICPDRQTGRRSWAELQAVCPGRDWRFKEINVPYEEVIEHRSKVIALLHPHDTEMDLSIGLAFYFASRPLEIDSPRILLSGLGADELFGGYARHGTAFARAGYSGLIDELELDLNRLGKRNLGRDDRIIANWGREARFPFLDERLLQEVISWPVHEKCGFGAIQSGGDWDLLDNEKKVLRLLAWRLNMKGVAAEKKRADSKDGSN
ncbi:hypothetical protein ABW19_dt0203129 [Dactylella cylindrospora]|nr:hypothetical protein ABW19_dt0203129 [Dactylella cylindrospora]